MKIAVFLASALFGITVCQASDHAVALAYHHVSEDTPALTSVSPDTFADHLRYLDQGGFQVWPLGKILDAIENQQAIPANTVALSFDDAYRSVYDEAFPRMRRHEWPLTLFVNTEAIDKGYKNSMNWAQIRELVAAGAEIGNHSQSHGHLVRSKEGETETQWKQRVIDDIKHAEQRLIDETGIKPTLFAYPYGEYSNELKDVLRELNYYGIAQQSGAIGTSTDLLAVPRFPMSSGYANMNRFAISVHSRPLPVTQAKTSSPRAPTDQIDELQLTFADGDYRQQQISCYTAGGQRLSSMSLSTKPLKVRIDLDYQQNPGRNKINCTAPSATESGTYYWYSYQWLVKNADGSWYRE